MEFTVTIDQFEGPLDLMLHLIKENKLDLFDLNMNILADQYIAYINQMKTMRLEIASEYLSELASLIEYKSKKLLPREKVEVEQEYEEDQREKLVERLLEYQKYKEASALLKEGYLERQKLFTRPQASIVSSWQNGSNSAEFDEQSPYDLMKAMDRVIARMVILKPYETKVTIKEMSVEERMEQLKNRLKKINGKISFDQLCTDCTNLHMVIVTFLAILDMIHDKYLNFTIDENETIWVMKGGN